MIHFLLSPGPFFGGPCVFREKTTRENTHPNFLETSQTSQNEKRKSPGDTQTAATIHIVFWAARNCRRLRGDVPDAKWLINQPTPNRGPRQVNEGYSRPYERKPMIIKGVRWAGLVD